MPERQTHTRERERERDRERERERERKRYVKRNLTCKDQGRTPYARRNKGKPSSGTALACSYNQGTFTDR